MTPKLSIIIPVYNKEPFLKECLDSTINQTFKDIEIILINDFSSDNSESIILEYQEKDPRIKYIKHDSNKGAFEARKNGVLQAVGSIILFLDGDDILSLDTCEIVSQANNEYDIITYSMVTLQDDVLVHTHRTFDTPLYGQDIFSNRYGNSGMFMHWASGGTCYKKEMLLLAFSYIPKNIFLYICEDFFLDYVISYLAKSFISYKDAIYYYRAGSGTTSIKYDTPEKAQKCIDNFNTLFISIRNFKEAHSIDNTQNDGECRLYVEMLSVLIFQFSSDIQTNHLGRFFDVLNIPPNYHPFLSHLYNVIRNGNQDFHRYNQFLQQENHNLQQDYYNLQQENHNLQQENHNLQHNKWYHFGQLSRKQKIKKIIVVISKKLKIYPILKYVYKIVRK